MKHVSTIHTDELNSFLFSEKFINLLILNGKKIKAYKLFFSTLEFLKQKAEKQSENSLSALEIVEHAILHCMPSLEVRKVRVAGTTYLVPAMIPKKKQEALAMRWIIEAAKKKEKSKQINFCSMSF